MLTAKHTHAVVAACVCFAVSISLLFNLFLLLRLACTYICLWKYQFWKLLEFIPVISILMTFACPGRLCCGRGLLPVVVLQQNYLSLLIMACMGLIASILVGILCFLSESNLFARWRAELSCRWTGVSESWHVFRLLLFSFLCIWLHFWTAFHFSSIFIYLHTLESFLLVHLLCDCCPASKLLGTLGRCVSLFLCTQSTWHRW